MGYSTDVKMASYISESAHRGAVDKAGAPYIRHPERVASRMETDEEKVVAWLHDVVEDTDITLETIRSLFGNETADAVDAITHRKGEMWSDYLIRVKGNPISKTVKISDLIDNSNLSRLPNVTAKDIKRVAKYHRALMFLMDVDGE